MKLLIVYFLSILDIETLLRGLADALATNRVPLVVTVIGYCLTVIVPDACGFGEDDRHGLRLEFGQMVGARRA